MDSPLIEFLKQFLALTSVDPALLGRTVGVPLQRAPESDMLSECWTAKFPAGPFECVELRQSPDDQRAFVLLTARTDAIHERDLDFTRLGVSTLPDRHIDPGMDSVLLAVHLSGQRVMRVRIDAIAGAVRLVSFEWPPRPRVPALAN